MKNLKEFVILEEEKQQLKSLINSINHSPYQNYIAFKKNCETIVKKNLLTDFLGICNKIKEDRKKGRHYHLVKNCPIDDIIPIIDLNDSVNDKYEKKKTFVGEGFLLIFSLLTESPILGYETRNNGDMYQDVLAHNKYTQTQTQKTDGDLFFHNDRTAHNIRADYLNLLGLRTSKENKIYTGYIDGKWILDNIDEKAQKILREPYFVTPFDNYSKDSNTSQQKSENHAILFSEQSFRYYDCRTAWADDAPEKAKEALIQMKNAIVKAHKIFINVQNNDLFTFANLKGLHSRLKVEVPLIEEGKNRWLLKTYNFESYKNLDRFSSHYFKETPGLLKEIY